MLHELIQGDHPILKQQSNAEKATNYPVPRFCHLLQLERQFLAMNESLADFHIISWS